MAKSIIQILHIEYQLSSIRRQNQITKKKKYQQRPAGVLSARTFYCNTVKCAFEHVIDETVRRLTEVNIVFAVVYDLRIIIREQA